MVPRNSSSSWEQKNHLCIISRPAVRSQNVLLRNSLLQGPYNVPENIPVSCLVSWLSPGTVLVPYLFLLSVPVSPPVCRCTQVFERKWEIGLAWESQLNGDGEDWPGPTRLRYDLLRAAAAEFLGTLLLLYNGEIAGGARGVLSISSLSFVVRLITGTFYYDQ